MALMGLGAALPETVVTHSHNAPETATTHSCTELTQPRPMWLLPEPPFFLLAVYSKGLLARAGN